MVSRFRRAPGTRISFFAFQDIITSVTGILILITLILTLYLNRLPPLTAGGASAEPAASDESVRMEQVRSENARLRKEWAALSGGPSVERLRDDVAALRRSVERAGAKLLETRGASKGAEFKSETEARLGLEALRSEMEELRDGNEGLARTNRTWASDLDALAQAEADLKSQIATARAQDRKVFLIPERNPTAKQPILAVVSERSVEMRPVDPSVASRLSFDAARAEARFADYLRALESDRAFVVFYVRPSGIATFHRLRQIARDLGFDVGHDALSEDQDLEIRSSGGRGGAP